MLPERGAVKRFAPEAMEKEPSAIEVLRSDAVLTSEMIYSAKTLRIYSTKRWRRGVLSVSTQLANREATQTHRSSCSTYCSLVTCLQLYHVKSSFHSFFHSPSMPTAHVVPHATHINHTHRTRTLTINHPNMNLYLTVLNHLNNYS